MKHLTNITISVSQNADNWEWHVIANFDNKTVEHAQGVSPTPNRAVKAASWWVQTS